MGNGNVEAYSADSGEYLRTVATGIDNANSLLVYNGYAYVSTGAVAGEGTVRKISLLTGTEEYRYTREGARITGIARDERFIYAAVGDQSALLILNIFDLTLAEEVALEDVQTVTEVGYCDKKVYVAGYNGRFAVYDTGTGSVECVDNLAQTALGVTFVGSNAVVSFAAYQGLFLYQPDFSANEYFRGNNTLPAGCDYLANDGTYLAASHWRSEQADWIRIYRLDDALSEVAEITEKVVDPKGIAFLTSDNFPQEQAKTVQIGNYVKQPSLIGTDWTPTGRSIFNIQARTDRAAIAVFGMDTEGGDRAKTNTLREEIGLIATMKNGEQTDLRSVTDVAVKMPAEGSEHAITYTVRFAGNISVEWKAEMTEGQGNPQLVMHYSLADPDGKVEKIELKMPFNPRYTPTNVIADDWDIDWTGNLRTPAILSSLDLGQLSVNGSASGLPKTNARSVGSRLHKTTDFYIDAIASGQSSGETNFSPVYLEKPSASIGDAEWAKVRRGLLGLLQCTVAFPQGEGGFLGSPGGIIGNNVISDPVRSYWTGIWNGCSVWAQQPKMSTV
mgnify:FL=1